MMIFHHVLEDPLRVPTPCSFVVFVLGEAVTNYPLREKGAAASWWERASSDRMDAIS